MRPIAFGFGNAMVGAVTEAIERYAKGVRETLRGAPTHIELALAPAFKRLTEDLLASVPAGAGITLLAEYAQKDIGRPDIALKRAGEPPRAFIELKAPYKKLDPARWKDAHDKRQFKRFGELPTWALSNFTSIQLYRRDVVEATARVAPEAALDPLTSDAKAAALIAAFDSDGLFGILGQLAIAQPPTPRNAAQLAEYLAHGARLVRESVLERLGLLAATKEKNRPLQLVRDEFREVLYAHPEAGGYRGEFDTLFSAAFAQTLAFGLLLVRDATNEPVDRGAWEHMPDEHPLMKSELRVLSEPEIFEQSKLGFDVLFDTVNSFDPVILSQKPGGRDPILYFYEDFLSVFDAEAKQRYGVYYTPVEVVRYMVGALNRALRDNLGTQGLTDDQVTLLDPASGTGTFLLGIAERVRADVTAAAGPGAAVLALRQLATRMFAFELLIGPYAVAHYRLHHALAEGPPTDAPPSAALPRLGIYLADTLAEVGTSAPMSKLGYTAEPIHDERAEADRIKGKQSILAIIGNPPYWRFQGVNTREIVGPFIDDLWEDLKAPVRDAGWANQLNTFPEFSIAFWRWSIWKLFEADNAPKKGVIAFITNRTFLAGKPYAGLRKMMRERFDRIEVIDLRGDVRRGARAGVHGDTGVFNIKVGTAITIAIADGSKETGELADIFYTDTWEEGLFPHQAKLQWLDAGSTTGTRPGATALKRSALEDFKPIPFQGRGWPAIDEIFYFSNSGVQTKRNGFAYALSKNTLLDRLNQFESAAEPLASTMFGPTDVRPTSRAQAQSVDHSRIRRVVFRPLDVRYLYNHEAFLDRPRPALQGCWGFTNLGLYTHKFGIGAGPATWAHSILPDYDMLSGRGGYAFPLYDRRAGHGPLNLNPALIDGLSLTYHVPVSAEAAFDAMLALLSATSYTLRFAEDLEDVFPHVPFPASRALFEQAAKIGAAIREVETFARPPDAAFAPSSLARFETAPTGALSIKWEAGELRLCADGSGRVTGISAGVWDFSVSGYHVLRKWLIAREGIAIDDAFRKEFQDITGRINELIHHFDQADLVLEQALNHSLTRDDLGL